MPNKDFLPARDDALLTWSNVFSAGITAQAASIGLTPAQCTAYASLHSSFSASLAISSNPATRTRGAVSDKNDKRAALKAEARELARIINAFPATTNQQRLDLGLNPRSGEAAPINPPAECPELTVVSAMGRTLRIKLRAVDSEGRGKPPGVHGASLFSFVGAAPPADISDWVFEGSTTRTIENVTFPPTVPAGSQVWLCAFWFNPRSQSGPACTPVSAYLAGGVAGAAA